MNMRRNYVSQNRFFGIFNDGSRSIGRRSKLFVDSKNTDYRRYFDTKKSYEL